MAKLAFTKLGLKRDDSIQEITFNDQIIEVKQYLSMEEKMEVIATIVNNSIDDSGYYNPLRVYVNLIVEIIKAYTNITFTEKQSEDILKLYDLLVSSGLSGEIIGNGMNPSEYQQIKTWVSEVIHNVYEYRNSIYGILEGMKEDYSDLNLDASEISQKLADPEGLTMIKEVLDKLG